MGTEQINLTGICLMSGDFEHKLDSQRRVSVPSEWRTESSNGVFMLIPGKENTLQLYTNEVFQEKIMSKIKKLSPSNPDDLKKLRQLGSQMFKCECDKQGRIQIPQKLMDHAKLTERIALIGSGDFGQIMDADRWQQEQKNTTVTDDSFLDILG